ncbi:MAG: NAD-dependent epimerase/dehydratase family protein [Myxococcota bacterium]
MVELSGKKIMITGPAGQIAFPLAERLARENEVFGVARFSDAATRERCEAAGIHTAAVDLANPDWSSAPAEVDYLIHFAAAIVPGEDFDASIQINATGTGHVMSKYRNAAACLMMSTCGVYAAPRDYSKAVLETDPLGGTPQPYAPTYCISKISQEAVAKFSAEEFGLPTTIARMNAAYGDNGGFPAMVVDMILGGVPIGVMPDGRGHVCSPIHEDDIYAQTPGLLAAASTPATIVNWGGDEPVPVPEMAEYIAGRIGREVKVLESEEGIHQYWLDATRRIELAGPCRVPWREGVDRMIAARHPEIELQ